MFSSTIKQNDDFFQFFVEGIFDILFRDASKIVGLTMCSPVLTEGGSLACFGLSPILFSSFFSFLVTLQTMIVLDEITFADGIPHAFTFVLSRTCVGFVYEVKGADRTEKQQGR